MSKYATLNEVIREATFNSENWNDDGSINWSFVDADAYAICFVLYNDTDAFYDDFNEIADVIIREMREEAQSEAQFEMEMS
jgi:hypothetical protein